jgi:hypothetical protein
MVTTTIDESPFDEVTRFLHQHLGWHQKPTLRTACELVRTYTRIDPDDEEWLWLTLSFWRASCEWGEDYQAVRDLLEGLCEEVLDTLLRPNLLVDVDFRIRLAIAQGEYANAYFMACQNNWQYTLFAHWANISTACEIFLPLRQRSIRERALDPQSTVHWNRRSDWLAATLGHDRPIVRPELWHWIHGLTVATSNGVPRGAYIRRHEQGRWNSLAPIRARLFPIEELHRSDIELGGPIAHGQFAGWTGDRRRGRSRWHPSMKAVLRRKVKEPKKFLADWARLISPRNPRKLVPASSEGVDVSMNGSALRAYIDANNRPPNNAPQRIFVPPEIP